MFANNTYTRVPGYSRVFQRLVSFRRVILLAAALYYLASDLSMPMLFVTGQQSTAAVPVSAARPASVLSPIVRRASTPAVAVAVASNTAPVTRDDVIASQKSWASAIKRISQVHKHDGDYVKAAADAAGELYAYGKGNVLFKPTKAVEHQFRPTPEEAMSYFVGGKAVANGLAEDGGFAINGGKGWSNCVFDNHQIETMGGVALAMGNYYFTCATTGEESKVEYTFGYKRCDDGQVRVFLHHSSMPYKAAAVPSVVHSSSEVTKADVIAVQTAWADAIKRITEVYKYKGNYVNAAADAAGELYAYGQGNVLFKPTKATDQQFRPTPEEAMSYFVGGAAVENGYGEDGGFAINGGKGWSDVEFDNHQIEIKSGLALAMGNYYFTCDTTGEKSKVEYTFGYQRCDDGKLRIFLHHSSMPYKAAAIQPKVDSTAPVTEEDVIAVQNAWAAAMKRISQVYRYKGDYMKAAAEAAGKLYIDDKDNVLFKPAIGSEHQFRSTPADAMSYFVGSNVEDGGFAINGGKGWSDCVYDNHQIEITDGLAMAMGDYYFTGVSTGEKFKVDYTFGYKRCDDGQVRIFLHHSSVPYKAAVGA